MPTPTELLLTLQGNDDPDAQVLLQMAQMGADLSKSHIPEFVFDIVKESSAHALAEKLAALDYDVALYTPDANNPEFQIVAKQEMLLDLNKLIALSQQFEALASQYDASYDGWGAEIVE